MTSSYQGYSSITTNTRTDTTFVVPINSLSPHKVSTYPLSNEAFFLPLVVLDCELSTFLVARSGDNDGLPGREFLGVMSSDFVNVILRHHGTSTVRAGFRLATLAKTDCVYHCRI